MADGPPLRVLLIVTGSSLRAEEMDRPLGYYLKQRIEQALGEAIAGGREGLEGYVVRVVADIRWIHDDPLQELAHHLRGRSRREYPGGTLARGGPRLAGLRRPLLHPDGSRPGRAPRQRLGHGQRHHSDRRLRVHRPIPPAFPRAPAPPSTPISHLRKATSRANPGPTSTRKATTIDVLADRLTDRERPEKPSGELINDEAPAMSECESGGSSSPRKTRKARKRTRDRAVRQSVPFRVIRVFRG